jgi:hypothetical protein
MKKEKKPHWVVKNNEMFPIVLNLLVKAEQSSRTPQRLIFGMLKEYGEREEIDE